MSKNVQFIQNALDLLTLIATTNDRIKTVTSAWFARDYLSLLNGDSLNDDLVNFGITKTDLENAMYLLDSLQKFLSGQDAPKANFLDTLNKLRSDI